MLFDLINAVRNILSVYGYSLELDKFLIAMIITVDNNVLIFPLKDIIESIDEYELEELTTLVVNKMLSIIELAKIG